MEKQLNFEVMLSLKEIALRKVVISCWNKTDFLRPIIKFLLSSDERLYGGSAFCNAQPCYTLAIIGREKLPAILEDEVKREVQKLALFKSLEEELMLLVRPINIQIWTWIRTHEEILADWFTDMVIILEQLCWKNLGTIDHQKTAEKLVCLETLGIEQRYRLACFYCLEDKIQILWGKLDEERKRWFYNKNSCGPIFIEDFCTNRQLEFYWPFILEGKEFESMSSYRRRAFENLCIEGNTIAAKYFFQKLTNDQKQFSLSRASFIIKRISRMQREQELASKNLYEPLSDVIVYLLSLMSLEQQMQFVQRNSLDVLICFLYWPWLDLLPDIADQMWAFFPEEKYCHLLEYILDRKSILGYGFSKFFFHSPYKFKKYVVDEECSFLTRLCSADDVETIIQISRTIDDDDRVRLFTCFNYYKLLNLLIEITQWHIVERFLRGTTASKKEREILKESLKGFLSQDVDSPLGKLRNRKFKRVFEFLHQIDHSKRRYEEDTLTSGVKQRCQETENKT